MKLREALFSDPEILIYEVSLQYPWEDENWDEEDCDEEEEEYDSVLIREAEPVLAPILAAEYVKSGKLDGSFALKGTIIDGSQEYRTGYLLIVMPEGIVDGYFIKEGDRVIAKDYQEFSFIGRMIPSVAIDHFIPYTIFHCKRTPEIGINVLRNSLSLAKEKWEIASQLGYILRDERRYDEAVETFSLAIEEGKYLAPKAWHYRERAGCLDRLGNTQEAEKDRQQVEAIESRLRKLAYWQQREKGYTR
jgi:tetratricopeptide (TPR) repeat protein